jgi:dienelactone hydrolase
MNWDLSRLVDFLETLPFVDTHRIGSIGHSHGAYGTHFGIAFEPRISAAIASCGFTTFRRDPAPNRWSHLTPLIPQLGCYLPDVASIPFDWHHVCALAAPRPVFVWYATRDSVFPKTDNLDTLFQDVRQVYRLYGADSALAWQAFDGEHRFPEAGRKAAYAWLEKQLAGRGTGKRQGDKETRRQGDKETRRRGDEETRRQGDEETRRQGDKETRRQGDKETRRQGDKEKKEARRECQRLELEAKEKRPAPFFRQT